MNSTVRSVFGAALQTASLLNIPLVIPQHSTLNEKFNILANQSIADTDRPSLKYVTIGNGGHTVAMGANNVPYVKPIQHLPRHAALYNHLPFVLRTLNDDLSATEVAKYRLRTTVTINGVSYVAYYLKVLDLSNTSEEMDLYTVTNGITTSTAFAPNSGDLNPTPPNLPASGAVTATGDYIAATALVPFVMTTEDIAEFANVCNIMYGTPDQAIISEIGLCSGIDKNTTGSFGSNSSTYTEAVGVQIMSFVSSFFATQFTNTGINISLNCGSLEPLLALS